MSAIASESASPCRAGATEAATACVCSRSRVMDMSMVSALFGLALALADSDRDLAGFATEGDADGDGLANAIPCQLLLKLFGLAARRTVDGAADIAEDPR